MSLELNITAVGCIIIFLALVTLTLIITLFGKLLMFNSKKDNSEKEFIIENCTSNISDNELIAVITAAITASLNDSFENGFRVKSFRRIPQSNSLWNTVARNEQVLGKLHF